MKRRDFGKFVFGGALSAASTASLRSTVAIADEASNPQLKAPMYVAEDHFDLFTNEHIEFLQRHGVKHVEVEHIDRSEAGEWNPDELKRLRDLADASGLTINMLNFSRIRKSEDQSWRLNSIMRGDRDGRDREIDIICGNIEKAAAIGVPAMRYHWKLVPDYRNGQVEGAGGNRFLSWDLPENWQTLPRTEAGRVPLEEFYERIEYFLARIMPVAETNRVRIACHPPDPPLPPGYKGVDTWNYRMFDGLKRYASLTDSPNFGFLLCVGTVGEGLVDPGGEELIDIVRYFGEQEKIFAVHLRNIRGARDHFVEWYPDSGDMDFYRVMKTLRDVHYSHAILPDHVPSIPDHPDDPGRKQAFAYGFGYIKALIQAVNSV